MFSGTINQIILGAMLNLLSSAGYLESACINCYIDFVPS